MTLPHTARLGPGDIAVALLVNLVWGLNIFAVKLALAATTPFVVAALRQWIVFLACVTALRVVPGRMRAILLLGLLHGGLFLGFINLGVLNARDLGALAIASQLGVPFSLLLGIVFLGERIHGPRIAGIALAVAGVMLVAFDPAAADDLTAFTFIAASALVWAATVLLQRRLAGVPVPTLFAWVGLVGGVTMTLASAVFEPASLAALPALPLGDLGWIAFSALGSTLVGQGGVAWLLQRHLMTTVSPLTLASPVVAVATSALAFDTPLTPLVIVGGMMALAGVTIITVRGAARGLPVEGIEPT